MPTSTLDSTTGDSDAKTGLRDVLELSAVARLVLGWGSFLALSLAAPFLAGPLSTPVVFGVLAVIVAVIIVCATGVVTQAEHLAHRLGDPYGTLVLTLSVVLIEVILICAVMLGPGENPTIARDSVMAVSMIILNLIVGMALMVGAWREGDLRPNRAGVSAYLTLLVVLGVVALILPGMLGGDGTYSPTQALVIIPLTAALYAFFLYRQMGPQRQDFQEITSVPTNTGTEGSEREPQRRDLGEVWAIHRTEILVRAAILVGLMVPIVLLSHDMAALLDIGLARVGAPVALAGVLIAMIVFLPETFTTIRAALLGEGQRVSNLCHGALVSTVGVTIPAVLAVGLFTGQPVVLAESPANIALFAASLFLTQTTFSSQRVTALHGSGHLFLFALYGLTLLT